MLPMATQNEARGIARGASVAELMNSEVLGRYSTRSYELMFGEKTVYMMRCNQADGEQERHHHGSFIELVDFFQDEGIGRCEIMRAGLCISSHVEASWSLCLILNMRRILAQMWI